MKITQLVSRTSTSRVLGSLTTNLILVLSTIDLCQKSTLFTQLFQVPIGQFPWAPGNLPIGKKKKKVISVRNLEMDLM